MMLLLDKIPESGISIKKYIVYYILIRNNLIYIR